MKTYSILVSGNHCHWSFTFQGNPKYLDDWLADGLDVYEVIESGLVKQAEKGKS